MGSDWAGACFDCERCCVCYVFEWGMFFSFDLFGAWYWCHMRRQMLNSQKKPWRIRVSICIIHYAWWSANRYTGLDHNEILNVRWATVDPNPLAQKREAHRLEEQAAEAVRRALPADFVAELEGRDPEARKRKKIEGSFGLDGYEPSDEIWYARTREIDNSEETSHQLESSGQPLLIENAPAQDLASTIGSQQQESGGILSSSTLAALKGFALTAQPAAASSGGPLVAYGSDDDSEWFINYLKSFCIIKVGL